VKNYDFDFNFSPPWGQCSVTMTSVIGHLTNVEFPQQYRVWQSCSPGQLFDCPINVEVDKVCVHQGDSTIGVSRISRTRKLLQPILPIRPNMPELYLSGLIVIERGSTLAPKSGRQLLRATESSKSRGLNLATRRERMLLLVLITRATLQY